MTTLEFEIAQRSQPSAEIDLDVQKVVLDVVNRKVKGLDTRIDQSMIDGEVDRTITGASTLTFTVHDPKRALLLSGMFDYTIEVTLDKLHWRLAKVTKQDDNLTLTFEDREVAYLRELTAPKKASRSKMTRAEFAYSIVREVKKGGGIAFYCPELHTVQPIENQKQKTSSASRKATRSPGIGRDTQGLTVRGTAATATQKRNAERALDVGNSLNAPAKAQLALMEACIVESSVQNLSGGDRDSAGILQVRASTAGPMRISNRDIEACCNAFLTRGFTGKGGAIDLARKNPSMSAGAIAQAVQGSAYPTRYDQAQKEAQAFVDVYAGGSDASSGSTVVKLPYQYTRGASDGTKENSWDCLQRLASEVNWRCFMTAGVCYFVSDITLAKAKPSMVLSEKTPGVIGIDFDIDHGKVKDQVTVTCRAARWLAAPGAVVVLEDVGPADGRWLVAEMRRGLFDASATITLQRPQKALPEPAASTTTVPGATGSAGGSAADIAAAAATGSPCARAYQAAMAIAAKRFPYVWAGGHGSAGTPSTGSPGPGYTGHTIGFDCSGSTVAVLAAAGLGFTLGGGTADSGTIARSWGAGGEGKCFTVWANAQHVFIIFHTSSGDEHWGTGSAGNNGGFAHQPMRSTSGFTARHWYGM